MDIFSIIIIFAVGSMIVRFFKRIGQASKQAQTQAQIEATKGTAMLTPVPKPAPKPADFRFPPVQRPASVQQLVYREGRNPDTIVASDLSQYQSIKPSAGMNTQFSDYKGSLDTARAEGIGYQAEAYENVSVAYQDSTRIDAKILPEAFNRNALIQAVVMSEILKRPGASRR
ncbi:MAG: hypothetical protein IH607_03630 [Firmicutes bacterium]|nr:hypothetical protein [Bacillota bacterium]